jgi:hypothetical protein
VQTVAEPAEVKPPAATVAQTALPSTDLARIKYGAWLIGGAFVLMAAMFIAAVVRFPTALDVTAIFGAVTGVIGTIIGAFFGVQAGSSGTETAENARSQAQKIASAALAKLDPNAADEVLKLL